MGRLWVITFVRKGKKMTKISTIYNKNGQGYDLYVDLEGDTPVYNLVPEGADKPHGGYASLAYIMNVKGFRK